MKKTKMLKKNYEFRKVLSKGEYFSGENIEAFVLKNKGKGILLGIAINKKIAKAVKRNLIKRLLRENYRKYEKDLKEGFSIVFLWKKKKDIKYATYDNISKDMFSIFDNSKLFIEKNNYEKDNIIFN